MITPCEGFQYFLCLPSSRRLYVTVGNITGPGLVLMLQLLHLRLQLRDHSEGFNHKHTHEITKPTLFRFKES